MKVAANKGFLSSNCMFGTDFDGFSGGMSGDLGEDKRIFKRSGIDMGDYEIR